MLFDGNYWIFVGGRGEGYAGLNKTNPNNIAVFDIFNENAFVPKNLSFVGGDDISAVLVKPTKGQRELHILGSTMYGEIVDIRKDRYPLSRESKCKEFLMHFSLPLALDFDKCLFAGVCQSIKNAIENVSLFCPFEIARVIAEYVFYSRCSCRCVRQGAQF